MDDDEDNVESRREDAKEPHESRAKRRDCWSWDPSDLDHGSKAYRPWESYGSRPWVIWDLGLESFTTSAENPKALGLNSCDSWLENQWFLVESPTLSCERCSNALEHRLALGLEQGLRQWLLLGWARPWAPNGAQVKLKRRRLFFFSEEEERQPLPLRSSQAQIFGPIKLKKLYFSYIFKKLSFLKFFLKIDIFEI